jgi:hypothetical protein
MFTNYHKKAPRGCLEFVLLIGGAQRLEYSFIYDKKRYRTMHKKSSAK